jgi:hypothetical protein
VANNTGAVFSVVRAETVARQCTMHTANNTGAVFSVVRAETVARQCAMHTANNTGAVFSVVRAATVVRQCAIHAAYYTDRCFLLTTTDEDLIIQIRTPCIYLHIRSTHYFHKLNVAWKGQNMYVLSTVEILCEWLYKTS